MSFDLFLMAFRDGANVETEADAAAARSVLERVHFKYSPEYDAYDIDFADGSRLELYAAGLHGSRAKFTGGMFALRGFSDAVGDFIFEFARAAGCVILPASEPASVLLPRNDLAVHLPPEIAKEFTQIPVADGRELIASLNGGYDAWQAYRDRVRRTSSGDPSGGT